MTCFWDGLIKAIDNKAFQVIGYRRKPSPKQFVSLLKNHNRKTRSVICNGEYLTNKQLNENYQAIKELDINRIHNGYYCSTFDPFLFLVSELFLLDIYHKYNRTCIIYQNIRNRHNNKIKVFSNRSHFWS
jgi:hypothetical protein